MLPCTWHKFVSAAARQKNMVVGSSLFITTPLFSRIQLRRHCCASSKSCVDKRRRSHSQPLEAVQFSRLMSRPQSLLDLRGPFQEHHLRTFKVGASLADTVRASGTSADFPGRQLQISHILVPLKNETLLDNLEKEILGGEPFAALAKTYSLCPTAEKGGELGWVPRGKLVPQFEEAAFEASVGELVRAETQFGLHLIWVSDERKVIEIQQVGPLELAELMEEGAASGEIQFLDVREPNEYELASLPQFELFPLSGFGEWSERIVEQLDKDKQTVVLCHHGVRSQRMAQYLVDQGFQRVANVSGGIDAYSRLVDTSIPLY